MTNYSFFEHGFKGLFEAELVDIFPEKSIETRCLSYALYQAMHLVQTYTERLVVHKNLDNLPSNILDYLAMEKSLPYYDSSFPIDVKRQLLRDCYDDMASRGTTGAVEKMLRSIFASGSVVEWFDFTTGDKTPGYFDISIGNEYIDQNSFARFVRILKDAKNVSRHLRSVRENDDSIYNSYVLTQTMLTDHILIS